MYDRFDVRRSAVGLALASAVLLASAAGNTSHHGAGKHDRMPAFADFDLNGDGIIVAAEFHEARAARMAERARAGGKMKNAADRPTFEAIDLDDDDKVTPAEFATHREQMRRQRKSKQRDSQNQDDN